MKPKIQKPNKKTNLRQKKYDFMMSLNKKNMKTSEVSEFFSLAL